MQPMRPMQLVISSHLHFDKFVILIIIVSAEVRKVIGCSDTDCYLYCVCLYELNLYSKKIEQF